MFLRYRTYVLTYVAFGVTAVSQKRSSIPYVIPTTLYQAATIVTDGRNGIRAYKET